MASKHHSAPLGNKSHADHFHTAHTHTTSSHFQQTNCRSYVWRCAVQHLRVGGGGNYSAHKNVRGCDYMMTEACTCALKHWFKVWCLLVKQQDCVLIPRHLMSVVEGVFVCCGSSCWFLPYLDWWVPGMGCGQADMCAGGHRKPGHRSSCCWSWSRQYSERERERVKWNEKQAIKTGNNMKNLIMLCAADVLTEPINARSCFPCLPGPSSEERTQQHVQPSVLLSVSTLFTSSSPHTVPTASLGSDRSIWRTDFLRPIVWPWRLPIGKLFPVSSSFIPLLSFGNMGDTIQSSDCLWGIWGFHTHSVLTVILTPNLSKLDYCDSGLCSHEGRQ